MALSREKKHSRDLKEELNDKEIIDVEQNVKKDDSKAEKNDDKNELQEILDNVQAEKEALMSKLELLQNEHEKIQSVTGKSFSEALILASTIPKYDKRLFIELQVQYLLENCKLRTYCIPYARHYNPLLISNRSRI